MKRVAENIEYRMIQSDIKIDVAIIVIRCIEKAQLSPREIRITHNCSQLIQVRSTTWICV